MGFCSVLALLFQIFVVPWRVLRCRRASIGTWGTPCLGGFSLWRFWRASRPNAKVAPAGRLMPSFPGDWGDWHWHNLEPGRKLGFATWVWKMFWKMFWFFLWQWDAMGTKFKRTAWPSPYPTILRVFLGQAGTSEWEDVQRETAGGWVLERPAAWRLDHIGPFLLDIVPLYWAVLPGLLDIVKCKEYAFQKWFHHEQPPHPSRKALTEFQCDGSERNGTVIPLDSGLLIDLIVQVFTILCLAACWGMRTSMTLTSSLERDLAVRICHILLHTWYHLIAFQPGPRGQHIHWESGVSVLTIPGTLRYIPYVACEQISDSSHTDPASNLSRTHLGDSIMTAITISGLADGPYAFVQLGVLRSGLSLVWKQAKNEQQNRDTRMCYEYIMQSFEHHRFTVLTMQAYRYA